MQLVKGHNCLHKLARQSMSPPLGTSILAIALPSGTSHEPKARGWPGGGEGYSWNWLIHNTDRICSTGDDCNLQVIINSYSKNFNFLQWKFNRIFEFVEILFNLWILAFSDGNSRFESGSPDCTFCKCNMLFIAWKPLRFERMLSCFGRRNRVRIKRGLGLADTDSDWRTRTRTGGRGPWLADADSDWRTRNGGCGLEI